MDAKFLPSSLCPNSSSSQHPRRPSFLLSPSRPRLRSASLRAIGPASSSNNNNEDLTTKNGSSNNNDDNQNTTNSAGNSTVVPPPPRPPLPPGTLNIRYRPRRLKKQAMQQESKIRAPPPKKDWDDMTMGEKAMEIYVGEKGLLFWLNKFAYASIFIIIGGWILFRFVGPSIGIYQLDTPPLSPTSIFKGSP